jgi:hypothetical protein
LRDRNREVAIPNSQGDDVKVTALRVVRAIKLLQTKGSGFWQVPEASRMELIRWAAETTGAAFNDEREWT